MKYRYHRSLLLVVSLLLAIAATAQNDWGAAAIPDSLKRGAYSVVRNYELTVNAPTDKALTMHFHTVVTVLSKKGDPHASWGCYTSKFKKLVSFSGKVYDKQGKVVAKLKKSDVHTSQYSEHLASDNQTNYVKPPVMDYPYTIEYDWEIKAADGYMEYGFLSPIDHSRQALERARFALTIPAGTEIRHTAIPHEYAFSQQTAGKNDIYTWEIPSMRCILDDDYEDHALYILPSVIAVPRKFCIAESSGTLDSWESLGRWYAQLAEGRDALLPADVQKVRELTAACSNDREKIEALYTYLGEKTRYVSIQLGIGGWQPMDAAEVSMTGFGDCKALTNYMQALLREAGIRSYQTIISTEYADLLKGFPNMHQTDHVILTIPQSDGSNMVVECTNPQLPLGFVSGNYAGHEALQIKDGEGRLIRIADYTQENNYETMKAVVDLRKDGTSTISFACDYYGARYGQMRGLAQISEADCNSIIANRLSLKAPVVTGTTANESCDSVPHVVVRSCINATYGDVHGDKIFISCNPFRNISIPRLRKDRQRDIVLTSEYSLNDEITIHLPEGYTCRAEDIDDEQTTDFGSYAISIKQEGDMLYVKTKVCLRKGHFSTTRKDDFIAFRQGIHDIMKKLIILESGKRKPTETH